MALWDVISFSPAVQAAGRTGWEGWPFASSGAGFSFVTSAARILFVLAVFLLLVWILRKLFGPGGPLRPTEFGTEHIAERKRREAARCELRKRWKAGQLTDDQFDAEMEALRDE